jgi:cupin 2 domain-containing protein
VVATSKGVWHLSSAFLLFSWLSLLPIIIAIAIMSEQQYTQIPSTFQADRIQNLLENVPEATSDEVFTDLIRMPGVRIERIVSNGQTTPDDQWYDQEQFEWVLLLTGYAKMLFKQSSATDQQQDDVEVELKAGSHVLIEPHRKHRVTATGPNTVWLAVWFAPQSTTNAQS